MQLLRGMFAFLIWDEQQPKAFAARDALSIKPLYYLKAGKTFVFAAELRAILISGYSSRKISSRGIMSYPFNGTVAEPDTAIKNVKMLPASTYLTWKAGRTKLHQYYNLDFTAQHFNRPKSIKVASTALEHSIRAHLVGDVPVGILLNSGIDSMTLVAIARKISKKKINTYSIAFKTPESDKADITR